MKKNDLSNENKFIENIFMTFTISVLVIVVVAYINNSIRDFEKDNHYEIESVDYYSNLPLSPIDESLNHEIYFNNVDESLVNLYENKEHLKTLLDLNSNTSEQLDVINELIINHKYTLLNPVPNESHLVPTILRDSASELYDLKHLVLKGDESYDTNMVFDVYDHKIEELFKFKRSVTNGK